MKHPHPKVKTPHVGRTNSSLRGSRDASTELVWSQKIPGSPPRPWRPAFLLTLIASSIFRVSSAFWWVNVSVSVRWLRRCPSASEGEIFQVLPKLWLPSNVWRENPAGECTPGPKNRPSASYGEWLGDEAHAGVGALLTLGNFFLSQRQTHFQRFYDTMWHPPC